MNAQKLNEFAEVKLAIEEIQNTSNNEIIRENMNLIIEICSENKEFLKELVFEEIEVKAMQSCFFEFMTLIEIDDEPFKYFSNGKVLLFFGDKIVKFMKLKITQQNVVSEEFEEELYDDSKSSENELRVVDIRNENSSEESLNNLKKDRERESRVVDIRNENSSEEHLNKLKKDSENELRVVNERNENSSEEPSAKLKNDSKRKSRVVESIIEDSQEENFNKLKKDRKIDSKFIKKLKNRRTIIECHSGDEDFVASENQANLEIKSKIDVFKHKHDNLKYLNEAITQKPPNNTFFKDNHNLEQCIYDDLPLKTKKSSKVSQNKKSVIQEFDLNNTGIDFDNSNDINGDSLEIINNNEFSRNSQYKMPDSLIIDSIDDEEIEGILRSIETCLNKTESHIFIEKLYDFGILDLISAIVIRETLDIFEIIFCNSFFYLKDSEYLSQYELSIWQHTRNLKFKDKMFLNKLPTLEILRKKQENEVIVKNKQLCYDRYLKSKYKIIQGEMYSNLAQNLKHNFYFILKECQLPNIINTTNFLISKLFTNHENLDHFFSILLTDNNIYKLIEIMENNFEIDHCKLVKLIFIYVINISSDLKPALIAKLLQSQAFFVNLVCRLQKTREAESILELSLIIHLYIQLIEIYNQFFIDSMDLSWYYKKINKRGVILRIQEILSYSGYDKSPLILLFKNIYRYDYTNFIFPSTLIIFRKFVYEIDKDFCEEYFEFYLKYIEKDRNNIIKSFFKFSVEREEEELSDDGFNEYKDINSE